MSSENVFQTALYKAVPYHGLPCELDVFTIRNKPASSDDFGYSEDVGGPSEDEDINRWGCCDRQWFRDNAKRPEAMQKYDITAEEFDTICDMLESVLCVGCCGWCT